ncbi:hypothetical protein AVEN_97786-1 [Araneus ventricosus]|uniref:Uncharacterized protein n=1 Tax=Araneus ventricosus TaxID=182803 RepID=A0A4Y2SUV7_ARAVE|nr:hypothetical protein AVEN_97786-1 [Araneus ventricosus]
MDFHPHTLPPTTGADHLINRTETIQHHQCTITGEGAPEITCFITRKLPKITCFITRKSHQALGLQPPMDKMALVSTRNTGLTTEREKGEEHDHPEQDPPKTQRTFFRTFSKFEGLK